MSPRQRVPIPFGGGLDRAKGPMVADPQGQEDLRNVRLADGFAHVRLGTPAAVETFSEDHVIAGAPFEAGGHAILVAYDATSRAVKVYTADADGTNRSAVGTWFTLSESATSPPNVFLAEVDGLMFFAHDEELVGRRAPTKYYDPDTGSLSALTAAWAHGDGIRFRGVTSLYGTYLIGWGYGTSSEARPEYIRASLPLDPTTFELRHYLPAGARSAPVLRVISNRQTMVVFKAGQTYHHVGGDRATFDILPLDPLRGISSSRLAVEVEGAVFAWTAEGPRIYTPQPQDLSIPLEVRAPAPSDLVAAGADADGFASYYPPDREVRFHFGQRVYGFQIDTREWTYHELGFTPIAAFLLDPSIESTVLPGSVENLAVTDDSEEAGGLDRDVTVDCDHVDMAGDETLELWAKPSGGAWAQNGSVAVSGTSPQSVVFEGLQYGTAYELQIRAKRGGSYLPDYDNADPDTWPAASYLAYTTTLEAPSLDSLTWSRVDATTEKVAVQFTPAYPDVNVEVYRDDSLIATVTAATHGGSQYTYDDEGITGETDHDYKLRTKNTTTASAYTGTQSVYAGPSAVPTIDTLTSPSSNEYNVAWSSGGGEDLEIHDNYAGGGATGSFALRNTVAAAGGSSLETLDASSSGVNVSVKVRAKETVAGVADYGKFSAQDSVTIS